MLEEMRALAGQLGIAEHVEFAGWRYDDDIRTILSTADVCLAPDPPSPLNDVSTMIKIPEYMAMGRPIVSYDLTESRVSAGDAALYAEPGDVDGFAAQLGVLLDDPDLRARMGRLGRERVEQALAWQHSEPLLLAAYERALQRETAPAPAMEPAPIRP
jgi:glycosyltransferase involved in cell wall biosynthesis